jgi:hypothetical protein
LQLAVAHRQAADLSEQGLLVVGRAVTDRLAVRQDFDLDLVQAVEVEDLAVQFVVQAVVFVVEDLLVLILAPHLLQQEVLPQEQVVHSSLLAQTK